MSQDPERDADMKRIEDAAEALGEHFDTVQIFVTRHIPGDDGGTANAATGRGSWFTRYGQVRTWLVKADERSREEVRHE